MREFTVAFAARLPSDLDAWLDEFATAEHRSKTCWTDSADA